MKQIHKQIYKHIYRHVENKGYRDSWESMIIQLYEYGYKQIKNPVAIPIVFKIVTPIRITLKRQRRRSII